MLDTLLLRPSLHFTTLHPATLYYTYRHFNSCHLIFTQLHFTALSFDLTTFKFPTAALHLTSLHFTSHHFPSRLDDLFHTSIFLFLPVYNCFLNSLSKNLKFTTVSPNASAGSSFQFLIVLFTN